MTRRSHFDARYWLQIAMVVLAYLAAAKFGFALAFATKQVTAVWPPTGIAVAALVLLGLRIWPGVFLGAWLANALSDEPLATAAGIAVGNTLGPALGAYLLLRWLKFDKRLGRIRDVFALVGVAPVSMAITATNGVANLALSGIVPWSAFGSVWWIWWVGDAMGMIAFAPLLLTFGAEPAFRWRGRRALELGVLYLMLLILSYFALSGFLLAHDSRIEYAVFPLLIWCALRFSPKEATVAVVLVIGFAIWGAIHDRGPFASGSLDERLVLLEIFLAVVALTSMALAATMSERRRGQDELMKAHSELELRVEQRTTQLAAANLDLQRINGELARSSRELAEKNEEVEAFVYIVSHDLRGPLVNLQGFSQELESSCQELEQVLGPIQLSESARAGIQSIISDGIRGALHYISASSAKFQRLIDALLTLSRSGRQDHRSENIDVSALVATTLDSLRQSLDGAHAEVSVGALPAARGDLTAVGQVFANLIGNAIKYAQPGRPVQIELGGTSEDSMVHYWVRDNGSGIPEGARRRLFQVFQRFHPHLAAGDGMGLAIIKRVIERHGGRIWADSEEGVGTTFHLTLPASTGSLHGGGKTI